MEVEQLQNKIQTKILKTLRCTDDPMVSWELSYGHGNENRTLHLLTLTHDHHVLTHALIRDKHTLEDILPKIQGVVLVSIEYGYVEFYLPPYAHTGHSSMAIGLFLE